MFDPLPLSQLDTLREAEDAGVVATIGVAAAEENAACARRLAAMGELYARRAPDDDDERTCWLIDGHESLTAEVAAELGISRGRARGQLRYAIALRDDLPRLMSVFLTGAIDMRMVIAIINGVALVGEPELMGKLDAVFAKWSAKWMRMSGPKLEERIDWWVDRIDPEGRRVASHEPPSRYVEIWPSNPGLSGVDAQLRAAVGVALDMKLNALADTVCPNDPRSREVRRADAVEALVAGLTEMRCECGSPDCAGAQRPSGTNVVIHVLAEQDAVDGTGTTPGYLPGYGSLPAPMVHDLSDTAKCKPLPIPERNAPAESGYRPSAALAEFVRCRDLTCRFPGCDRPAEVCDIDHTMPWPAGATHPSNLKLLCRAHHLLKTFWTGVGGWGDRQLGDGTVVWTSPNGRTYTTKPGGALFFPQLATPTGELAARTLITERATGRGVMMPRRKHTRQQDRQDRIAAERRMNAERIADEHRRREEWLAATYEPPPF